MTEDVSATDCVADGAALPPTPEEEAALFGGLQGRLRSVWERIEGGDPWEHTSVVVPSLSLDQRELAKVEGASWYEERLLFTLIRLRHPRARVIYITSQPVHPEIVDYYLQLLVGVPASHARRRLHLLSVYDSSDRPLTEKVLARPRVIERLRLWIGDPERAYLTCFNSTVHERRLAVALGVPLNGVDPALLSLGTKSGCRKVFKRAGVTCSPGFEDLSDEAELIAALDELAAEVPGIERAVVKLNESFSGEGNAIFRYPASLPEGPEGRRAAIAKALTRLEFSVGDETYDSYLAKLEEMGGIVEAFVEGTEVRSPSVQMRIEPDGTPVLISSHEQVLGGATSQVYIGCRFPADEDYRQVIQEESLKIGRVLSEEGVVSRFGIDFLLHREPGEPWQATAIEVNLRMGGTTHPFLALQFLTGGKLDPGSGAFVAQRGQNKFYFSTDNLKSPAYRGLLPEDLMDIVALHRLHFEPGSETGVLFHMIGALSEFGKVGVTAIGNSPEEVQKLYDHTVRVLDRETDPSGAQHGRLESLLDRRLPRME